MPAIHGVVRWRLKDLTLWIWEEFQISLSETTLSQGTALARLSQALGSPSSLRSRP